MKKTWGKLGALALAVLLLPALLPVGAQALEMQDGLPAIASSHDTVASETTIIGFGGYEWYVVGYNGAGINPVAGAVTLLARATSSHIFGSVAFRNTSSHPLQDFNNDTNNYEGSTLEAKMSEIYGAFGSEEQALIVPRTLIVSQADPNREISGTRDVTGAYVWPFSEAEYRLLDMSTFGNTVTGFSGYNWGLRSPGKTGNSLEAFSFNGKEIAFVSVPVSNTCDVRPALTIDLSSVLFTSTARGEGGKSAVTVGSGLAGVSAPARNVKLTVSDGSIAPTVTFDETSDGTSTLRFDYSGAATGTNRYLSCVLMDSGGDMAYYGKLADCATESNGVFSIDTSGLAADTYTLKIYSEQANDDNYTDFAGAATSFTLGVAGGTGTVTSALSDNTPPTVSSVSPSGSSAAVNGSIVITFSEAMNTASGVGSVALDGGGTVSAPGAWSSGGTTYTIPYSGLANGTLYTIGISGFQDAAGNTMDAAAGYTFTTVVQGQTLVFPGNTGPTLTFTDRTLADSASGVTVSGAFTTGAKLTVKRNTLHKEGACAACDEIRERMRADSLIVLYDISATGHRGDGVSVTIPVGNGYDGRLLSVLHCDHGRLEEKILTCTNGAVTGTFNSLSPFAVFDGVSVATPDAVVVDAPKTGDSGLAWVGAVCLLCTLVAINRKLKMEN